MQLIEKDFAPFAIYVDSEIVSQHGDIETAAKQAVLHAVRDFLLSDIPDAVYPLHDVSVGCASLWQHSAYREGNRESFHDWQTIVIAFYEHMSGTDGKWYAERFAAVIEARAKLSETVY